MSSKLLCSRVPSARSVSAMRSNPASKCTRAGSRRWPECRATASRYRSKRAERTPARSSTDDGKPLPELTQCRQGPRCSGLDLRDAYTLRERTFRSFERCLVVFAERRRRRQRAQTEVQSEAVALGQRRCLVAQIEKTLAPALARAGLSRNEDNTVIADLAADRFARGACEPNTSALESVVAKHLVHRLDLALSNQEPNQRLVGCGREAESANRVGQRGSGPQPARAFVDHRSHRVPRPIDGSRFFELAAKLVHLLEQGPTLVLSCHEPRKESQQPLKGCSLRSVEQQRRKRYRKVVSEFGIAWMPLATREPAPPLQDLRARGANGQERAGHQNREQLLSRDDRHEPIRETCVASEHCFMSSSDIRQAPSVVLSRSRSTPCCSSNWITLVAVWIGRHSFPSNRAAPTRSSSNTLASAGARSECGPITAPQYDRHLE